MSKNYLNLGCGNTFVQSWTNVDFTSNSQFVIEHNLLSGIPFENDKFEVVYHSHVLEHFSKQDGEKLINECYRVLKKGGVLRIVIPDLEQNVKSYIDKLNCVIADENPINQANYKWAVIELIDQLVRTNSGGEMVKYWKQEDIINESFVIERVGYEFKDFRDQLKSRYKKSKVYKKSSIYSRLKVKINRIFKKNKKLTKYEELGKFRLSGEIHQWMYDRYSITQLLKKAGFSNIIITTAFESKIPKWDEFIHLDVKNNEKRKPDSLYIEAIK